MSATNIHDMSQTAHSFLVRRKKNLVQFTFSLTVTLMMPQAQCASYKKYISKLINFFIFLFFLVFREVIQEGEDGSLQASIDDIIHKAKRKRY